MTVINLWCLSCQSLSHAYIFQTKLSAPLLCYFKICAKVGQILWQEKLNSTMGRTCIGLPIELSTQSLIPMRLTPKCV